MTKKEIIKSFKNTFGDTADYIKHIQNVGKTTVRCEFIDYLDYLRSDKQITEKQAFNITASDKDLFDIHIIF